VLGRTLHEADFREVECGGDVAGLHAADVAVVVELAAGFQRGREGQQLV